MSDAGPDGAPADPASGTPDSARAQRPDTGARLWGMPIWAVCGAIAVLCVAGVAVFIYEGWGGPKRCQYRPARSQAADETKGAAGGKEAKHSNPWMNCAGLREWRWAQADHENIAAAIAACRRFPNLNDPSLRELLRLDSGPYGRDRAAAKGAETFTLSNFQRAAIYLSDAIARARFESALNASANHMDMFWFQLFIVLIGAVTTILISIKSITNDDQSKRYLPSGFFFAIGIIAIATTAIGTAASALNAFYGPRENYLKSERNLAALRQLHAEIAVAVASARKSELCGEFQPLASDAGGQDTPAGSSDSTAPTTKGSTAAAGAAGSSGPPAAAGAAGSNGSTAAADRSRSIASNTQYAKQIQDWTTRFGAIINTSESSSGSAEDPATDDSAGGE
jgi:hypothetical protein